MPQHILQLICLKFGYCFKTVLFIKTTQGHEWLLDFGLLWLYLVVFSLILLAVIAAIMSGNELNSMWNMKTFILVITNLISFWGWLLHQGKLLLQSFSMTVNMSHLLELCYSRLLGLLWTSVNNIKILLQCAWTNKIYTLHKFRTMFCSFCGCVMYVTFGLASCAKIKKVSVSESVSSGLGYMT